MKKWQCTIKFTSSLKDVETSSIDKRKISLSKYTAHKFFKSLKQIRFQLQPKSLKVCTNSSVPFINSKGFISFFLLKQLTLSEPVNACRECRALETASPHFSTNDQIEIKQDYQLVLITTYKSALNSFCWARQKWKTWVSGVLMIMERKAADAWFAWS